MVNTFPGPVPAYSNPPINPQYYQPKRFVISSITRGKTTTVTATSSMDYVIGQLVALIIPADCGIRQLNEQTGYVISIPASNEVVLDINSSFMDPFIAAGTYVKPQILPVGDINSGVQNAQGRVNNGTSIPGSFINISPQ